MGGSVGRVRRARGQRWGMGNVGGADVKGDGRCRGEEMRWNEAEW